MGERGPRPLTPEVLEARGSHRAADRAANSVSIVENRKPTCPSWLDKDAKRIWRVLCPKLHDIGLLAGIDRNLLARYCAQMVRYIECEEYMNEKGQFMPVYGKGPDGKTIVVGAKELPHVRVADKLSKHLKEMERELGLTPAARAQMALDITGALRNKQKTDEPEAPKGKDKGRFFK